MNPFLAGLISSVKKHSIIVLVTLVLFLGFIAFTTSNSKPDRDNVNFEYAFATAFHVVGGAIAAIGLLGMFSQWWSGESVSKMVPGGVIVLGGILLLSPYWATALAFAALLITAMILNQKRKPVIVDESKGEPGMSVPGANIEGVAEPEPEL